MIIGCSLTKERIKSDVLCCWRFFDNNRTVWIQKSNRNIVVSSDILIRIAYRVK